MAQSGSRLFRSITRALRSFFLDNGLNPLPIRRTFRKYSREKFKADGRAAFNVALLALPQGMAFAAIAELPIVYGIASSAIASIIAPMFAGSRHTILGPTNATALMVFSFFAGAGITGAVKLSLMPLLCLMVGIFCILGALLKVAELLQFISRSVLVGYISGAATLIIANQLKHLLGIADALDVGGGRTFVHLVLNLGSHLASTHWQPLALGILTLALFLLLQRKFRTLPNFAITLFAASLLNWALAAFLP
ncbi:MAG: SulP family inorganic anion transporter, partial [Verrucomicrobia bacterium]|nr:SulP family inorganic anion transporter [Verrucomicrobiota bacterium]